MLPVCLHVCLFMVIEWYKEDIGYIILEFESFYWTWLGWSITLGWLDQRNWSSSGIEQAHKRKSGLKTSLLDFTVCDACSTDRSFIIDHIARNITNINKTGASTLIASRHAKRSLKSWVVVILNEWWTPIPHAHLSFGMTLTFYIFFNFLA